MNNETKQMLDKVVDELKAINDIEGIVLYGSYARGEEHKGSDIDLLIIICSRNPKKFLNKIIAATSKHDKEGKISLQLTNLSDYSTEFLENVMREGKILFGKFVLDNKKISLKPYILISYDLSSLDNAMKVKVSRMVHGYETKKTVNKKEIKYKYLGIKDEKGVTILSNACLLIPESLKAFLGVLERDNIQFKQKNIWLRD